jgi:hypothetical protein
VAAADEACRRGAYGGGGKREVRVGMGRRKDEEAARN